MFKTFRIYCYCKNTKHYTYEKNKSFHDHVIPTGVDTLR